MPCSFVARSSFARCRGICSSEAIATPWTAEIAQTEQVRQHVYEMIDEFKKGIDAEACPSRSARFTGNSARNCGRKSIPTEQYTKLRELTRRDPRQAGGGLP